MANRMKVESCPQQLKHLLGRWFLCSWLLLLGGLCWGQESRALVVVVHPENPLNELALLQVRQIFLGRLRLFPNTGHGLEVTDQPHDTAIFRLFYRQTVGMDVDRLSRYRARYIFSGQGRLPARMSDSEAVKLHISNTREAIGYLYADEVDERVKVVFDVPHEEAVSP